MLRKSKGLFTSLDSRRSKVFHGLIIPLFRKYKSEKNMESVLGVTCVGFIAYFCRYEKKRFSYKVVNNAKQ